MPLVIAPSLPPDQVPPTPPMPTLSVTAAGRLNLHASLREALSLREDQPINLLPPVWGSPYWYLDLRPTAPCRVRWYHDARPRVKGISLPPGLVTTTLTLYLLPGEPAYPGYYPLLPENAFSTQAGPPPLGASPTR